MKGQKEEKKEKEKEEKFLHTGGRDQSKIVQEVLADLRKLLQNTKHATADYSLTTI